MESGGAWPSLADLPKVCQNAVDAMTKAEGSSLAQWAGLHSLFSILTGALIRARSAGLAADAHFEKVCAAIRSVVPFSLICKARERPPAPPSVAQDVARSE